jgi:hypothetical protein
MNSIRMFNKMKIIVVTLSILFMGCQSQGGAKSSGYPELVEYSEMLSRNRSNLVRLYLGMNKSQVINVMGIFDGDTNNGRVPNPAKSEMFIRGTDNYEILFYMTEKYPPFTAIRDSQATPVVLKNNRVIGWGWQVAEPIIHASDKPNANENNEDYVCGKAEESTPVGEFVEGYASAANPVYGTSRYTKQILRDECVRKLRMNKLNQ